MPDNKPADAGDGTNLALKPAAVLDPSDGHLRMNVDKDGLGSGPLAASPVGTIGNGTPCDEAPAEPAGSAARQGRRPPEAWQSFLEAP